MHLPFDYPRINQFPEWFTVVGDRRYALTTAVTGERRKVAGTDLLDGLPVKLAAGQELRWQVTAISP